MPGRRLIVAVLCGLVLAATPAMAGARHAPPVVAAGPQSEEELGERLLVRTHGRELCIELSDDVHGEELGGGRCSDVPRADFAEPLTLDIVEPEDRPGVPREPFAHGAQVEPAETRVAAGAVRSTVHFVEYELSEGRRIRIPTVPAPPALTGRAAGAMRYFLGALPPKGAVYSRRVLDAFGGILAEEENIGDIDFNGGRPPLLGPATLARGRVPGGIWSMSVVVQNQLDPKRGDPARRRRAVCLRSTVYHVNREGYSASGSSACSALPLVAPLHETAATCGAKGRNLIFGMSPVSAFPRAAVLGSGRRLALRRVALPEAFGAAEAVGFVVVAPRGAAIRSLLLRGGGHLPLGKPPPALTQCGTLGLSVAAFERADGPAPGGDVDVAAPGAPPLYVRDDGEELCVAVARFTRPRDCRGLTPWLSSSVEGMSNDRRMVGGAVDPRIAAVRVRVSNGTTFDVLTRRDPRYAGRWAADVAFFSAAVPAGVTIRRVDALDDRARALWPIAVAEPRLEGRARPLLRARGTRAPFVIGTGPVRFSGLSWSCLFITRGTLPRPDTPCLRTMPPPGLLEGHAFCDLGAAVLLIGMPPGITRAEARLGEGARVAIAVHRDARGRRVAIFVAPPRKRVRSVVLRRRSGAVAARLRLGMAPIARQCGYEFYDFFGEGP